MKLRWLAALVLLIIPSVAFAQSTTVSGTVSDTPDAQTWNNGTFTFSFVPNPQYPTVPQYTWTGGTLNPTVSGTMTGTGTYSVSVPSNTAITPQGSKWNFQFCPQATAPCFNLGNVTITGGTQTVNATPASIRISMINPPPVVSAYADVEIGIGAQIGSQYFNLTLSSNRVCTVVSGSFCTTWSSSGGGSANSVGPVINVTNSAYAGCPAAAGADWNTCFTSASTAYNNASLVGTPTVRASTTLACASCTSLPITFAEQVGDTVLAAVTTNGATSDTVGCSDNGGNVWRTVVPLTNGGQIVGIFGTNIRGVLTAGSTVTCTDNNARTLNVVVAAISNYGAERLQTFANSSSTSPSVTDSITQDANNIWLGFFSWVGAGVSASANQGTVLQNVTNAGNFGVALVSSAVASQFGSGADSLTLSSSQAWTATGIEIRSHSDLMARLYIPPGDYLYSGGLVLQYPGVLNPDFGARMCYIGSAHAVDFGSITGPSGNAGMQNFILDGGYWTCGWSSTEGIIFNPFIIRGAVRNAQFRNFGSSAGFMIAGTNSNFDLEVGPQNKFVVDDLIPRGGMVINNISHTNPSSYVRIHDNMAVCGNAVTNCNGTTTTPAFVIDGSQNRVYHNNLAGFTGPAVLVKCTNGCLGNEIAYNQIESSTPTGSAPIQFQGSQTGLLVHENVINMDNVSSVIAPFDGSSTLQGSRINFNTTTGISNSTPFIALNNLTGQTNNQSSNNLTSSGGSGPLIPAPIPHTTGSNIAAWNFNADDLMLASGQNPTITGTGACLTVSTPHGAWSGDIKCTGTTGASTLIITTGATAPNGVNCIDAHDITNVLTATRTAESATACTFTFTSVTQNDVIKYTVLAY